MCARGGGQAGPLLPCYMLLTPLRGIRPKFFATCLFLAKIFLHICLVFCDINIFSIVCLQVRLISLFRAEGALILETYIAQILKINVCLIRNFLGVALCFGFGRAICTPPPDSLALV